MLPKHRDSKCTNVDADMTLIIHREIEPDRVIHLGQVPIDLPQGIPVVSDAPEVKRPRGRPRANKEETNGEVSTRQDEEGGNGNRS